MSEQSTNVLALAFEFEGTPVRFVGTADAPEWVADDVCAALGIADAHASLRGFSETQKGRRSVPTPGGDQEVLTVTEAGLYRLLFKSRKPAAERFCAWATNVVLPEIRRTGSYGGGLAELVEDQADVIRRLAITNQKVIGYAAAMMAVRRKQVRDERLLGTESERAQRLLFGGVKRDPLPLPTAVAVGQIYAPKDRRPGRRWLRVVEVLDGALGLVRCEVLARDKGQRRETAVRADRLIARYELQTAKPLPPTPPADAALGSGANP